MTLKSSTFIKLHFNLGGLTASTKDSSAANGKNEEGATSEIDDYEKI